jgi:hypothetical protein
MARCHPRALKRVIDLGKICKGLLYLQKKTSKTLVEWGKCLKETRLEIYLVSNSTFLNGDMNHGVSDSKLQ